MEVNWETAAGQRGQGHYVPLSTGQTTSGLLWFFEPDNWEMLVKVLNKCSYNGYFWVYAAASTDVSYNLNVYDTVSGRNWQRYNPQQNQSPAFTDSAAFPCF